MKIEERYIVIKASDLRLVDSPDIIVKLHDVIDAIEEVRRLQGKPDLKCVVVEKDWPEYETVWKMIEDRVDAE